MNLFRLLLLALAVYFVWRLINVSRRSPAAPPTGSTDSADFEPMQRCAQCGTHLPASSLSRAGICGRCGDR